MSTVPSLSRVDEWPCRGAVIEPVAVKFSEAVGPAHADDDGVGETSAGGDQSDDDGVAKASDDADAVADGDQSDGDAVADANGLVALPTQPATEVAIIRPAIASPTPA